jgi:hypothetical protein
MAPAALACTAIAGWRPWAAQACQPDGSWLRLLDQPEFVTPGR